jgi:O-succinylbenzoate synthase
MKLSAMDVRVVRMPLVAPFRSATVTETVRSVVLVRAVTPEAEGWGECPAMSEPYYTSEYVEGALDVLRRHLVPMVLRLREVTAEGAGAAMARVKGHPMAKCAVEAAVLDAELRTAGVRLADHLGGVRDEVDAGIAIGITGSLPELLDAVAGALDDGYRRIKLKIQPGWDVEPVRAVRERTGPAIGLQVDANGAYTLADADQLAELDAFDLLLIEQPLSDDDLLGHAELGRRLATPICLDESITSVNMAAAAIELGACRVINIKAGRVGGYLEAKRIHDLCAVSAIPVWCGGMLETGIGRAANVGLASLPNFTLPGDLSASNRYFATDITEPFVLHNGRLRVPTGPGIGVEPLPDVLRAHTVSVETLRA